MTKILIIEAKCFNDLAKEMMAGAVEHLNSLKIPHQCIQVPSPFEIPAAITFDLHGKRQFTGYIAVGSSLHGSEGSWDRISSQETTRSLQGIVTRENIALGYGIFTCDSPTQAWGESRRRGKSIGIQAAKTCIKMIELKQEFGVENSFNLRTVEDKSDSQILRKVAGGFDKI